MHNLLKSRNYVVIKSKKELLEAQQVRFCRFIVLEQDNTITLWLKNGGKWVENKYVVFDNHKDVDDETTGMKAYMSFYNYCGKNEVERMKKVFEPINMWESCEQMHYFNFDYSNQKIYKDIYEFDANSAFTYGTLQLPKDFDILKEYMLSLYEKKKEATNSITRSKYKNLQNYLIGYFARVKEFIKVRSEIIRESNMNIKDKMLKIVNKKGVCYLSNTDSIVTDEIGAEVIQPFIGDDVGKFKLSKKVDRLFYRSSNIYQLGDKVVYSGVSYFARKNIDFFNDRFANQNGSLLEAFDFELNLDDIDGTSKLCRVRYGQIIVTVYNSLGELVDEIIYKLEGDLQNV